MGGVISPATMMDLAHSWRNKEVKKLKDEDDKEPKKLVTRRRYVMMVSLLDERVVR